MEQANAGIIRAYKKGKKVKRDRWTPAQEKLAAALAELKRKAREVVREQQNSGRGGEEEEEGSSRMHASKRGRQRRQQQRKKN